MLVDQMKKRKQSVKKNTSKIDIPIGKWLKCDGCKEIVYRDDVRSNCNICPVCGHYFRMHINKRLDLIIDKGTYQRFDLNIDTSNPLGLEDYPKKLKILREKTGLEEGVASGTRKN
jgi:acetyl-CoA carboxylase carboxyl transferase subunit beta